MQATREECVLQLRVKDQVVAPSRTIVVHAAAGENVRRVSVDALVARQGRARREASASWRRTVTLQGGCRRPRCSVPAASAVRRSSTFPRSCCAAGCTRRRPGARHGLSERPAGGARSRSACAPPGVARSAGRPGLASSSSGAGLRRARRRRRRAPPGPDVVLQLSRTEEGRVMHGDVFEQPVHVRS